MSAVAAPPRRRALGQLLGRAGWNIGDQVVSSGTNLLLSVLVARSLSQAGFGAFSVAFTIYSLLVGAGRSLIQQPLVVRHTAGAEDDFREAARAATGSSLLLGVAAGVVTVLVGLFVTGDVGPSLVTIGVLLPGLLLQDMWRMVFIAQGRPSRAFVNDAVWAVVQFAAVGLVLALGASSPATMLLAWGLAALVAALVAGAQFRGGPRPQASPRWLASHRDLLGYYAASFLAVLGANQVTLLLIAGIGSPTVIGALRAAQVVLGPLNLLGYAMSAFAMPEIARRGLTGRPALLVGAAVSAVMVVVDLAYGAVLLLIPDSWGVQLLGASWSSAQAVLPYSLLGLVAIGFGFGASTLLVSLGFARESFWAELLLAPSLIGFGLAGLELDGARGAALGLSLAQCVVAPAQWVIILVLMRRRSRAQAAGAQRAEEVPRLDAADGLTPVPGATSTDGAAEGRRS